MSSEPPKLTFGSTPSTSSSSAPSLFGTSKPSGSSIFSGGSSGQSAGINLFGAGDGGKSAGGSWNFPSFGASSAPENNQTSGATADSRPGGPFTGFGSGSSTSAFGGIGGSQTPPKSAFDGGAATSASAGSTTPAPSGFSFKPSTTPAGPPPTDLFGGSTGGNNAFAKQDKDNSPANPFQALGKPGASGSTQPPAPGGNLFNEDKAKQPLPTFSWGKPSDASQNTTSGATTGAEAQKPLFAGLGQSTSNPQPSSAPSSEPQKPLFGTLGQNPPSTSSSSAPSAPSGTSSLFFQPPTSSAGSEKSKPFQFPSNPPSATQADTSDAEKQKPLFGGTSSQAPSSNAPGLGNLFSKPPTTSSAAPSTNLFNIGTTTPSTSGSQTPASSAAPTAASSAPFSSLFKAPDKPASATTTSGSQPAGTTTAGAAPAPSTTTALGTSVLGTSTAGPVPPVQSRLRNKTMDEILTRWASDLTKYTGEFKSHGETVAHWDQLLVENMSKISKLYISAVTAEKQTASVEMQLSAVENQQNELDSWLTKYEAEADEMLKKDGAGPGMELTGPDQERERTYKLAEKLNERLEDMGRDLGSMIDEVNAANAGLSKTTKADEPITQIVRILNSHLSQLQAIDQGTAALQAKINAAQQASQRSGFSGMMNRSNGHGNDTGSAAADDFYRSYMGRR